MNRVPNFAVILSAAKNLLFFVAGKADPSLRSG